MYTLLARVEDGHKHMMECLSQYIRDVAMEIIKAHETLDSAAKKEKETFVEPILELKEKFNALLKDAFQSDPAFQRTQSQAFEAALNSNRHSPEFLSLYIDEKLKRGLRGVSEDEVETVIDKGIELFRLISEKDVFERYYKQHLARRLLLGKSVSDYAERQGESREIFVSFQKLVVFTFSFFKKKKSDCVSQARMWLSVHVSARGNVSRYADFL